MYKSLIAVFLLLTCAGCQDKNNTGSQKQPAEHLVEIVVVKRAPIHTTRIITGTLESERLVHIHNEEQGQLKRLPYYPGDRVQAEDILAELDKTLITAQLDKARATYAQTELDLKRLKRLMSQKLTSEDELARAQTAVQQARAEQTLLETRSSHTIIKSPFSGMISERLREPGDVLPVHTHILTLFDPDKLIAKISVSEIIFSNLRLQQQVQLRIDALGDNSYPGIITRIHPTVDPIARQGIVEIKLDPVPNGALPGQLVRVTLETNTQPMRVIPLRVVRFDAKGEFVYRIDAEQKAQYTPIKTGVQISDQVEVIEGVNEGDRIVSDGFLDLRNGKKVKIIEPGVQNTPAS